MALNSLKRINLTPLGFKGLNRFITAHESDR